MRRSLLRSENGWHQFPRNLKDDFLQTLCSTMASRKGFEPLTYGLGNRCSILLSYRDEPAAA